MFVEDTKYVLIRIIRRFNNWHVDYSRISQKSRHTFVRLDESYRIEIIGHIYRFILGMDFDETDLISKQYRYQIPLTRRKCVRKFVTLWCV